MEHDDEENSWRETERRRRKGIRKKVKHVRAGAW